LHLKTNESWLTSDPLILTVALALLLLASILGEALRVNFFPIFGAIGILFFAISIIDWFRRGHLKWLFVIGTIVFSVFLASAVWGVPTSGTGFLSPLFQEDLIRGSANQDTLFHSSIANIFLNYKVPSTGLDGNPYLVYHY